MTPREWVAHHGGHQAMQDYAGLSPNLYSLWLWLAADANYQVSHPPLDLTRAVWLCWVYTRPGVAPEATQVYVANQCLNQIKASNGVPVVRVLVGSMLSGIDAQEGVAMDVIERSQEPPAYRTMMITARAAAWPEKGNERRAGASAWAWWWMGRSIAALPCPF